MDGKPLLQLTKAMFIGLLMMLFSSNAPAYVGPGLGVGTIGALLGIAATIIVALFAILWYPFRRLAKKLKTSGSEKQDQDSPK